LLCGISDFKDILPVNSVLTPHPGEMARLTGKTIPEIQSDRMAIARAAAVDWKCVVVLKGALTVIADPGGRVAVIPLAVPALATAGSGDVLAGMLSGLLAQGVPPFDAACAAAWMHARAGVIAEQRTGHTACVMAGDVINAIAEVWEELNEKAGSF
jgi:NAD(P)H-hydrate epimerase